MAWTRMKQAFSLTLCLALMAVTALFVTGCDSNPDTGETGTTTSVSDTASPSTTAPSAQATAVGEGNTAFFFTVTDKDGTETRFEVHTDKTIVGEALQDLGLIAGDEGEFGLYVKTVNGITVDYEKDGVYWAFYVDGQYATSGVDSTSITEGATYSFKVE